MYKKLSVFCILTGEKGEEIMGKRIITISREFGSGGRTIAKETAKKLGIPYYDKDLIQEIAKKTGMCEEFIREAG